ncbi:hypothetical protein Tco_1438650 [Tanacetum coccineum]
MECLLKRFMVMILREFGMNPLRIKMGSVKVLEMDRMWSRYGGGLVVKSEHQLWGRGNPKIIMENLPLDHNEFALAAEAAPNNNKGWIKWDVPLGGEMDEPRIDPGFDKEVMDDDDDGWDEDDEWLMAPVMPPRATVTVSSTYEVGGPSAAMPVGHPLAIMAPRVATQPQVIDDLCIQMDNLEYRHGVLTRWKRRCVILRMAYSLPLGDSTLSVTTVEVQW